MWPYALQLASCVHELEDMHMVSQIRVCMSSRVCSWWSGCGIAGTCMHELEGVVVRVWSCS